MAANSQSRGIASFGKRFANQIWNASFRDPAQVPHRSVDVIRRGVHISAYDKNLDEPVPPSVVPDDVIQPQSDQYWAPHPQTGVFGPTTEQHKVGASGGGDRSYHSPLANGGGDSVLEQKAWFRPLEDVEKPNQP